MDYPYVEMTLFPLAGLKPLLELHRVGLVTQSKWPFARLQDGNEHEQQTASNQEPALLFEGRSAAFFVHCLHFALPPTVCSLTQLLTNAAIIFPNSRYQREW